MCNKCVSDTERRAQSAIEPSCPCPLHELTGAQNPLVPVLAVRLDDGQSEPLVLGFEARRIVASVRPSGLNRRAVAHWLERHEIPLLTGTVAAPADIPSVPLIQLATLVICIDPRIRDIAALYARSVGAKLRSAACPDEVLAEVEQVESQESVSIFVLNDRLDDTLCHAVTEANRRRRAAGRSVVTYGFLSAFTPEQLAWLVVKSWVLLRRPQEQCVGFGQWDFAASNPVARLRSPRTGATRTERVEAPWATDRIAVLGLRAHGAPFDASMGRVVLCGHLEPPLPRERTLRAPTCFHDGVCFRMKGTADAPTEVFRAVDASPLVWCLDSCASLPFTGNAFGEGTSYVFGLIAGAAVGVIGPFLDVTTGGAMNRQSEALLATGATLGQVAAAACRLERSLGFDKFLLIGSPDLRLLPPNRVEARRDGKRLRYQLRGERQYIWRLAIPPDFETPVIVADDGGSHWAKARCHWFDDGSDRDLLVILDEPADMDGWLLVGSGGKSEEQLGNEAARLQDSLEVLTLYPFVDCESKEIERCHALAGQLLRVTQAPDRIRSRFEAALLLANLQPALDALHRRVADRFLAQVGAQDFNFDRMSSHGFDLEPTERTTRCCPACGAALYVTLTLWRKKRSYARRWVQCANCSGISMVLEDSPLEILPPVAVPNPDGRSFRITIEIRNRTTDPVEVLVAGLARHGSPGDAAGPVVVTLAPGSLECLHFSSPLDQRRPGVISYRVLVLCRAAVEFFALKFVLEPTGEASASTGELQVSPALKVLSSQSMNT
jgi:hypothetical protein